MVELNPKNQIRVPLKIASARYHLPIIQQKIVWAISNYIKDNLTIEINASRLAEFCDFPKAHAIQYLDRHCQKLREQVIHIETDEAYEIFGWVDYIKIDKKTNTLTIDINKKIQPFYHYINEHYIAGERKALMSFKKEYTPRMYELLRFKTKFQNKVTRSFTKSELLKALDIDEKSQYATRMSNLKDKIITPSIQEINEKTDMDIFKVEYIRTGRSISDIEFSWRLKESTKKAKTRAKKKTAAAEPKKTVRLTKADKDPKEYAGYVWAADNIIPDKIKLEYKKTAMSDCPYCKGRGWIALQISGTQEWIQQQCRCKDQMTLDL